MGAWNALFSIRSTHEYFAGKACASLEYRPTAVCQSLLLNANVALRHENGGMTAYAETDKADRLPDTACFDFTVYSRDQDFLSYTDGISPQEDSAYYLHNDEEMALDGRLSKEAYVSDSDRCAKNDLPQELQNKEPLAPLFSLRITVDTRKLADNAYYIPLRARRTNWHYYISGSGVVGSDIYVADSGGEEAFEYCGEVELPNGLPASHFCSRTPLPLLQTYVNRYSLRDRYNGRSLLKWLPAPSARRLGQTMLNGEEVLASQMFINL